MAVEYILLVAISVSAAVLVASLLVSRNPEAPGVLTGKWRQIIERIAGDNASEVP